MSLVLLELLALNCNEDSGVLVVVHDFHVQASAV
jgi:hypothetical protein